MKQLLPILLGATVVISGCNTTDPNTSSTEQSKPQPPRKETTYISEQEAMRRSERVSNVDYDLSFELSNDETFHAKAQITFALSDTVSPLTIDLNEATRVDVKINGKAVDAKYNKWFITLNPEDLNQGNNTLEIDYSRVHSTNGEGLHRFKDPVDGKVYLYSHFEPAAAHQMFPSFDQPDLKATYTLTVNAPNDWHVLSAKKESSITQNGDKKLWKFPKTPKLSTYNFSLHAGPYKMWQDNSGKYPARLFARQSVAKQIVPEMWFTFTRQGFGFFEEYFDIPYPFEKYDQVLVPDFLYGAMENAAAVTFDERSFLSRGKMSKSQQESLAQTIMHEMAHQWFGNLVTMKWWNGLWLNESFAAFMTYLATAEATEFDYAWRTFYVGSKQSAYRQDQSVTTHPIEVPIPTAGNAFDNIDAITYSKGASVLRQMTFLLGPDVFRQGVRNYLKKYSYQNATLDDLFDSLAEAANRDLSEFKQQWLYHAGVNSIEADFSCNNGEITSFALKQTAPKAHQVLREQRVNLGLFNLENGQLRYSQSQAVTYKGSLTEVPALKGAKCPDLVYPNYQDWGFVKVNLDDKSFATVKSAINTVDDTLLRSMLWQALSDSVGDGVLPLNEFTDVLLTHAVNETDYTIMRQLSGSIRGVWSYLRQFGDEAKSYRDAQTLKLEDMTWQAMEAHKDNPNFLRLWFSVLRSTAQSEKSMKRFVEMLEGKRKFDNLHLHQGLRWSLIRTLNRQNYPGALAMIDQELTKDKSDNGAKQAVSAKAMRPDTEQKAYWLAQFEMDEPKHPFPMLRYAMGSLFPADQDHLHEKYADQILASLKDIDSKKPPTFMRTYAYSLVPSMCTPSNLERLEQATKNLDGYSETTKRALLSAKHRNKRCLKVRDKMKF